MNSEELETLKEKIKEKLSDNLYHENLGLYGPFGANGGLDCFLKFVRWRNQNKEVNPEEFLKELGLPVFDWHNLNELDINKYISDSDNQISQALSQEIVSQMFNLIKKEYKAQTGNDIHLNDNQNTSNSYIYLVEQDLAVISIAFGLYVVEGKKDERIIKLAESAIKRQMLDLFIDKIDDGVERSKRKGDYENMLNDLTRIKNKEKQ